MVRQAMFKLDGSITDIPTGETERPQLERQGDLFTYPKDTENLARLKEGSTDNDAGKENQDKAAQG